MVKPVFLRFPLLASFYLLSSCASLLFQAQPPDVHVANIKPMGGTLFEQRLQVDLRIRNPNDVDLEVTGLDFTLQLNGQQIARGLANKDVTIPRLGDAVLSVDTTTLTLDIMKQLLKLRPDENVTYQIKGVLHLQEIPLPFDNEGILLDMNKLTDSAPNS